MKMKVVFIEYFVLTIALFTISCGIITPDFDSERAFTYLIDQCNFGTRHPGSDGIIACRRYILNHLEKNGAVTEVQDFEYEIRGKNLQCQNLIGHFSPDISRRIIIAAHYDTRPWADKEPDVTLHNTPIPGANDGASGVAVLLEIGNILATKPLENLGVDLVFFDLEDSGDYGDSDSWCIGSRYYAENLGKDYPEKAIIVDMIGDADLEIFMEYFSYQNSPSLVKDIWNIANERGYEQFKNKITNAIIDDHYPLLEAGIEAIDIIDFSYPVWHTMNDVQEQCSAKSLKVVGQVVIDYLYRDEK